MARAPFGPPPQPPNGSHQKKPGKAPAKASGVKSAGKRPRAKQRSK